MRNLCGKSQNMQNCAGKCDYAKICGIKRKNGDRIIFQNRQKYAVDFCQKGKNMKIVRKNEDRIISPYILSQHTTDPANHLFEKSGKSSRGIVQAVSGIRTHNANLKLQYIPTHMNSSINTLVYP